MIGVVIPAHNEEACLDACLHAVRAAALHPALRSEPVRIVAVLDDCSDGTEAVARAHPVQVLHVQARKVGAARAAGAQHLLEAGARWLAFTDADTVVSPGWLAAQLGLGAQAVCGSVEVDWSAGEHGEPVRQCFERHYRDADGHRHIHGANLGVCALAYRRAGGFAPLACSEDVALVEALQRSGATIAWSAAPRVLTSARTDARARGGFGDTLLAMAP
ncbi:glycosyltransferase family 2 protein [Aquabacterium soli]|uniref:Glycosyltransferase family 2 protein n=1 Tax=Aquabacterium soli TaxID=2493092 RepID=A0A3R8SC33_9BURK|nr:glycosyltransferase family 2 protein [Aquabacterium soli]RRS06122.1 glycosyltransferase family 2 protein [Aquabacterium soli]